MLMHQRDFDVYNIKIINQELESASHKQKEKEHILHLKTNRVMLRRAKWRILLFKND